MAIPLLLIAGIPAAGKSYFAEWLKSEKGFAYLDVDKDDRMRSVGLEKEWSVCLENRDASKFVIALQQLLQPIVLEWGFPTQFLPVVESLKREGFSIWWFNANYARARTAFRQRGTVSMDAFEVQMQGIERDWQSIRTVFAPNIITALDARGKRLSVKEIYRRISEKAG